MLQPPGPPVVELDGLYIPAELVQQAGAPPAAVLTLSRELQLQGRALGQSTEDAQGACSSLGGDSMHLD